MIRKPEWIKSALPSETDEGEVNEILEELDLNTVCSEANCPNIGECWKHGTATFMILGDLCTRNCRFCEVDTGNPEKSVDEGEPDRLAEAAEKLGLDYVVITSVDRDDLPRYGGGHFLESIKKLKGIEESPLVEALIPDFQGDEYVLEAIANSGADVIGHNLETVKELTPRIRDARAGYELSLKVLGDLKKYNEDLLTKSSLMLGMGEEGDGVTKALEDLRAAEVDIVTMGQYLRPSKDQLPVSRYVPPEEFEDLKKEALSMGFEAAQAGPFVRSSYKAKEIYEIASRSN